MENKNKVILDLCGGTGSWSKPYKDNGYTVYNITLPDYDVTNVIFNDNHMIFNSNKTVNNPFVYDLGIYYRDVYGILAAPTCTMFSLARTTAQTPRDFEEGMKLVKACLEIIWQCRYKNKLAFWALENPTGYLRQFLGKPTLTFNPCDYGDNYTKKTDLWGYFNEPKQNKKCLSEEEVCRCKNNTRTLPKLPDNYILPNGWNLTAAKRSMTSKHFAEAFYRANQ